MGLLHSSGREAQGLRLLGVGAALLGALLMAPWSEALGADPQENAGDNGDGSALDPAPRGGEASALQRIELRALEVGDRGEVAALIGGHGPPSSPAPILRGEMLKVEVDGAPFQGALEIQPFGDTGEGITVLLAVDTSGTMSKALPALKQGLMDFSKSLRPGVDAVALGSIGDDWSLIRPFTTDPEELTQALGTLRAKAKTTALFESIDLGLQTLAAAPKSFPSRRLMVVVSDGLNEKLGRSAEDCISRAQALGLQVHSLIYLTKRTERYLSAKGALETISRDSDALTITIDKPEELGGAMAQLRASLEAELRVTFDGEAAGIPPGAHRVSFLYDDKRVDGSITLPPRATPEAEIPAPAPTPEPALSRSLLIGVGGAALLLLLGLVWKRRSRALDTSLAEDEDISERPRGFRVVSGMGKGAWLPLPPEGGRLGFDPSNEVVLSDSSVSSHHAMVMTGPDGGLFIIDMDSTNGTALNEVPVGKEPVPLNVGDSLRLGVVVLSYEGGAQHQYQDHERSEGVA